MPPIGDNLHEISNPVSGTNTINLLSSDFAKRVVMINAYCPMKKDLGKQSRPRLDATEYLWCLISVATVCHDVTEPI